MRNQDDTDVLEVLKGTLFRFSGQVLDLVGGLVIKGPLPKQYDESAL